MGSFPSSFGQGDSSFSTSFSGQSVSFGQGSSSCSNGEVLNVDGRCVLPEVSYNYYSFNIPEQPQIRGPSPIIPSPKVENNVLFVHLPRRAETQDTIVVPPPRQNNILYLLQKKSEQGQRVITLPEQQRTSPEVFFVNYDQNENPILPGGVDLRSALSSASQGTSTVIDSGSSGFGGFTSGQEFIGQSVGGFSSGQGFGGQSVGGFTSGKGFIGQSTSGFSTGLGFGGQSLGGFSGFQTTNNF